MHDTKIRLPRYHTFNKRLELDNKIMEPRTSFLDGLNGASEIIQDLADLTPEQQDVLSGVMMGGNVINLEDLTEKIKRYTEICGDSV